MKRNPKTVIFVTGVFAIIAFVLLLAGAAEAQDGSHSHPKLEAAIAERKSVDAAHGAEIIDLKAADVETATEVAALKAKIDTLAETVEDSYRDFPAFAAEMRADMEEMKRRVRELEEAQGGPVDPPVEPPVEPPVDRWPLFLRHLDTGAMTAIASETITAPEGRYTVQIGESETETLAAAPFVTLINGVQCVDAERYPVYHVCGNDAALALNTGANAITIKAEGKGETKALTIVIEANAPPTGPPDDGNGGGGGSGGPVNFLTQVGPWFPATFNIEEPFANIFLASHPVWEGGGLDTPALFAAGYLDRETGLPLRLPNGEQLAAGVYFTGNTDEVKAWWDGEWVMEWEGDADLTLQFIPPALMRRVAPNRIEFTRDFKGGRTLYHARPRITSLDSPLTALRIYRKENEAAIRAGEIYGKRFREAACGYDIIRTMDLQSANGAVIRSPEDLATMKTATWGAASWANAIGEPQFRGEPPYQGMPIEAVLRLGVECDARVWFQAPITLGAPQPLFDFERDDNRIDKWAAAFADSVQPVAPQVLESPEWDRYADAFVEALIASGYPEDRPLYVSLANEVWNFSGHYFLTTTYAQRMGWGLESYLPISDVGIREAYGAMLARFKLALDAALERRGRAQAYVIAVEGQAAWPALTGLALRGAQAYMNKKGEEWDAHAPGFGVSVASYWGYNDQLDSTGIDYNDLDALERLFMDGPEDLLGTRANIVKLFRGAEAEGARYGVKMIGAYEGGPHFTRPWVPDENGQRNYLMTQENYSAFIWGERGARVNFAVNCALAEEFPGVILSNYGLAGPTDGQPFFEGSLDDDGPYNESWKALNALRGDAGGGCEWTPQ